MTRTARLLALAVFAGTGMLLSAPVYADSMVPHVDKTHPRNVIYPADAQIAGQQGSVAVDVYVGSSGRIKRVKISKSSGYPLLDEAALESVVTWRFVPATYDGETYSRWTTVNVVFQIPEDSAPPSTQAR